MCVGAAVVATSGRDATSGELDVVITEVHFNVFRQDGEADLEFVEIQNRGATNVDLGSWMFTDGIEFTFPDGTSIAPLEFFVVAANPVEARRTFGLERAFGPFTGRLENNGEVLVLANRAGHVIQRVHFDDEAPWPSRPDGRGPSLEFTGLPHALEHGSNDQGRLWKPSLFLDGTPGTENSRVVNEGELFPPPSPFIGRVINEILPPSGDDVGFVEFVNPLDETLDLSGHVLLSNAFDFVFEIPVGTELEPGALVSFSGRVMDLRIPVEPRRYALLAADQRTMLDDLEVTVVAGRSFGRFPDGDPDAHVLDEPTPGEPNVYSEDRSIVINEVHYHPPFVAADESCARQCSDLRQWIELHNPGANEVDLHGWRLSNGVRFRFENVTIPSEGFLVVAADVEVFRTENPDVEAVIGSWEGRLNHATDTIVLRNALDNPVDRVRYGDGGPRNDESPSNGVDDRTFRGSFWPRQADGRGPTLELVHPRLSNRAAVSWAASQSDGGTPGARNSRFDAQPAPSVRDVEHSPVVPASDQTVRVTCRISNVANLASAIVRWSVDGGGASGTVDLVDDGTGVDEIAGDEEYAAEIPGRSDGDVVRFAIEVADTDGESRRVPLEPEVTPYGGYPGTFYLYEVDDSSGPAGAGSSGFGPVYRVIMSGPDHRRLGDRQLQSNVLLPATFIAGGKAYHLVGVRYRGENSRREDNRSYKIRFHAENTFGGADNVNLNAGNGGGFGTSGFQEIVSSDLFRRADVPYPMVWPIAVHFPGDVSRDFDTRYVHKEAYDDRFLERYFGGSDGGNLYRPRNPRPGGASGDLSFRGEDPDDYRDLYEKRTNEDEDDFSDVIDLCRLFDSGLTPTSEFAEAVGGIVDVRQWARFFAVMDCLSNTDGGIWNNNGEDFFIYHVPLESSRPDAGRWLLLPWDLEETFQNENQDLFNSTVDSIERLFSLEDSARLYYDELRRATEGPFSRIQMRQRYDAASLMFDEDDVYDVVDEIDTNVTRRNGFVDSESSWTLDAGAVGNEDLPGETIVREGDEWRFFRGRSQPTGDENAWTTLDYDDSDWESGASGFGYGDGDDETVLGDMEDGYTTIFTRRKFDIADASLVVGMTLSIDYDDGYVAFLNGTEIARSENAPGDDVIRFDMTASSSHEASAGRFRGNPPEETSLGGRVGLLRSGENVLAIVGLNTELDSSDFSLIPELSIAVGVDEGGPAGGCGERLFAFGSSIRLEGVCDPVEARSVAVNGIVADLEIIDGNDGPWGARWRADVPLDEGVNVVVVRTFSGLEGMGDVVESRELRIVRGFGSFRSVGGTLSGEVTWSPTDGPYRMAGNVIVEADASLTIEPGTVILADEDASLVVRGELRAVGSANALIQMLAFDCGAPWGGIAFDGTGRDADDPTHELRYVRMRNGSTPNGQAFDGCVSAVDSKLLVANCEISNVFENAIDTVDAELRVESTHIYDIFEGIHCTDSTAVIVDSVIENMMGNSDAIDFDGGGDARSEVARCILRSGSDDGIDLGNVTVDIRDNTFIGIEDKAISMEAPGPQGSPTITGNLIYDSGTGMAIKDGIDITEASHNTVANCQEGIELFAKDESPEGGSASFHSTIVWGNLCDLLVDGSSSVAFAFSNVMGDSPLPGEGNIASDPMFVDRIAGDYSLSPESPCVASGRNGEDMGALPFGINEESMFLRGDVDGSGRVGLTDMIQGLNFLFRGAPGPTDCLDILDTNDDGDVNVSDVVHALQHLFAGGPSIAPPFPEPGLDPTPDTFRCHL